MTALRKSDVNLTLRFDKLGTPDGFVSITDRETIEICKTYLDSAWDGKREFRSLAKKLGMSTTSICALIGDSQRINGKVFPVLHVVTDPQPQLSTILLECGAIPDNLLKGWMIPCTEESLSVIRRILCKYFGVVLCTSDNQVGLYENKMFREAPKSTTQLHSEPVTVTMLGIKNAIIEARPDEKLGQNAISVFNGNDYISLNNAVRTLLPWIVVRYFGFDNKQRFALFDTLSWKIEAVTFGTSSAGTKLLVNRVRSELKAVQEVSDLLTII